FNGKSVLPMEGVSLVGAFQQKETSRTKPIFWEFSGNHAVRDGNWKLVAERSKDWELYNLAEDRSETNNLVDQHPDRVQVMAEVYDAWAKRATAKTHEKCMANKPSSQSQLFDLQSILKPKDASQ
ncbi:MAG: arylsulfatase, partial [Planctomycetota bacterium]